MTVFLFCNAGTDVHAQLLRELQKAFRTVFNCLEAISNVDAKYTVWTPDAYTSFSSLCKKVGKLKLDEATDAAVGESHSLFYRFARWFIESAPDHNSEALARYRLQNYDIELYSDHICQKMSQWH